MSLVLKIRFWELLISLDAGPASDRRYSPSDQGSDGSKA